MARGNGNDAVTFCIERQEKGASSLLFRRKHGNLLQLKFRFVFGT